MAGCYTRANEAPAIANNASIAVTAGAGAGVKTTAQGGAGKAE